VGFVVHVVPAMGVAFLWQKDAGTFAPNARTIVVDYMIHPGTMIMLA